MKSGYSKEDVMKMVYEYLKPLGMLGHLNRLNEIDWEKIDSNGQKKSNKSKKNSHIWKVKKVDI